MKRTNRRSFLVQAGGAFAGTSATAAALGIRPGIGGVAPEALREAAEVVGMNYPTQRIKREKIKITDIKVTPLSYVDPKRNLWRDDDYTVWKTDGALCQVFTDQGIVGIGEGTPYGGPEIIKNYTEEVIKPVLIGQNPFEVDFIACATGLSPAVGVPIPHRATSGAWAGVNNACWDIIGKALNTPVYKLLASDNQPDPHIRVYASGGVYQEWFNHGEKTLIEEALKYKQEGYTAFKFRAGTDWRYSSMTLKKYMPIVRHLREAVGWDMQLMHETLRACPVTELEVVEQFCPLLDELKFHWFEQPLHTIDQYIAVKKAMKVCLVSGGESDLDRFTIKIWIDNNAMDIVQTDCNVTGISENWFISRLAHMRHKLHCPHDWHGGLTIMQNAHMVASSPARGMLELNQTYNPLKEEIFKDPVVVKNGYMDLPNRPGFGVELIDNVEKKFPWAPGPYYRPNDTLPRGIINIVSEFPPLARLS